MIIRLDEPAALLGTERDVVLVDGDALDVPEPPASVLVLGSVRNSASVMYQKGAGLDYYVNRAGGFTPEADKKEVHIVKADGSAITGFANIRTAEPGDTVVVPPKREEKIRALPTMRDALQIISSTLLSIIALAALF
jgi:protein involved in polysaccharide export with SLBB domain